MEGFKQLRLKIDDGRKPDAFPLARLAEYLADFAALVGHKDNVHLLAIEESSTMPCCFIPEELEPKVFERVRQAKAQTGPAEANKAYRNINARLEEDGGVGAVLNDLKNNIIEFPGNLRQKVPVIGPFKEAASIDGEVERVGGKDESIPVWIKRNDGVIFHCETGRAIAKELAQHLYEPMRVIGTATRMRDDKGVWVLKKFVIQEIEELSDDPLLEVVARLRAIEADWEPDIYASIQRIRHGEEDQI